MKTVVIKVIKRKALADIARVLPGKCLRLRPITATTTVNDWIAESRKSKLDGDNASRERSRDGLLLLAFDNPHPETTSRGMQTEMGDQQWSSSSSLPLVRCDKRSAR